MEQKIEISKWKLAGAILFLIIAILFLVFSIFNTLVSPRQQLATSILSSTPVNSGMMGVNVGELKDWAPYWAFINIMKQSRGWLGSDWNALTGVPLTIDGYPTQIPYGNQTLARTLIFRNVPKYPAGQYTLIFDGQGEIFIGMDGGYQTYATSGVAHKFNVTPSENGILLEIRKSLVSDPIRNIRVLLPGYTNDSAVFTPEFITSLTGFSTLRFMDWADTNNNETVSWSQRTSTTTYTQTVNGVAWEYMIDLSNKLGTDMWINIPGKANDDYVTKLAALIKDRLNSNLRVYVEYGNEIWNGGFGQSIYAQQEGVKEWSNVPVFTAAMNFQARRSGQIWQIFNTQFATDSNRVVKVIASQAANYGVSELLINGLANPAINPTGIKADALAIAPYFGTGITSATDVTDVINQLRSSIIDQTAVWTNSQNGLAKASGLKLIAYEGGQHMWRTSDPAISQIFVAASRDSRMQALYDQMFTAWRQNSGDGLFMHFNSCFTPGIWGSWGLMENPIDFNNPKYLAASKLFNVPAAVIPVNGTTPPPVVIPPITTTTTPPVTPPVVIPPTITTTTPPVVVTPPALTNNAPTNLSMTAKRIRGSSRNFTFTGAATDQDLGEALTLSYSWNFGDGTTGVGQTLDHRFPRSYRNYTVKLTVSDGKDSASVRKKIFSY
ncbi:MAG: PKD domain-containing protein [Candidatus Paceibacterota bacterium]|jgi:hypothetical protein